MKIELDKAALQRRLKVVERIVPKRGGLPFQYVVNVGCVDGLVQLWASNAREVYSTVLPAEGNYEDGGVAIPAEQLILAVAAAPGETVTITAESGGVRSRIESGTARWNIEGMAGVDPAELAVEQSDTEGVMNQAELVRVLETVRYAASKNESRPSFMQIHVGEGRVVAADGRRVHQEGLGPAGSAPTFDLPERSVDTILEALSAEGVTGTVSIGVSEEGTMVFNFGLMSYRVTKLNYHFPDIDSLVLERARAQQSAIVCSIDGLVTALKVAAVACGVEGTVLLRFTHGVIEVIGQSQRGEGRMEVRASTMRSGFELSVNVNDLFDLLGHVTYEEGDISFTVTDSDGADPGWLYVQQGEMEAAIRPVVT